MTFPNHIMGFMKPKGPGYCAQYLALYNQFTNKPSAADALIQNARMLARVASGVYAKSERDFNFSVHTNAAGEAQLDWIDPVNHLPCTNVNGCVWSAYNGFTMCSSPNRNVTLNFNPVTNGIKLSQNSVAMGCGVGNDLQQDAGGMGCYESGTKSIMLTPRILNNTFTSRLFDDVTLSISNSNSIKHYAISRLQAVGYDRYLNLIKYSTFPTSTGMPNRIIQIGKIFGNDNYQYRYAWISSGLTETEINANVNEEEAYLDNYGTGLIP